MHNNNGVSLKALRLTATDSTLKLTPLIIQKRHFRTINVGMLSCFVKRLLYYCSIRGVLCGVEYYERS